MKQAQENLSFRTSGQGFSDISAEINRFIAESGIKDGLITLFLQHTSASLTVQENADPDVLADLQSFFHKVSPEDGGYRHYLEGRDDMPAHIRTALTDVSLSIPVMHGKMALGTWQGVYLCEHRAHSHTRRLAVHLIGE